MVILEVASWKKCFPSPFCFPLARHQGGTCRWVWCADIHVSLEHLQPTLYQAREGVFEEVPGAGTRAERVSGSPSSQERLYWMNEFRHYGTIAKAGAKLVLCLVARRILQLQGEMWLLLFSCIVFP